MAAETLCNFHLIHCGGLHRPDEFIVAKDEEKLAFENAGHTVRLYSRGSQPGVLVPPRGTRLNIKGHEDPWVTEQLIYLL